MNENNEVFSEFLFAFRLELEADSHLVTVTVYENEILQIFDISLLLKIPLTGIT